MMIFAEMCGKLQLCQNTRFFLLECINQELIKNFIRTLTCKDDFIFEVLVIDAGIITQLIVK